MKRRKKRFEWSESDTECLVFIVCFLGFIYGGFILGAMLGIN